jgi:hypothetical protein
MENVYLPAGQRTPEVTLDFKSGHFCFSGESYPENPQEFLEPIRLQLVEWLKHLPSQALDFKFKFDHVDSPSIKLVMEIIEEIEELNHHNKSITVAWYYPNGNRTLKELGEEIASELSHIRMAIIPQD